MTIYSKPNYRKIYAAHHGPIPKDELGRNYDIHHIDGHHSNNDPANLKAVTIQEHYDLHYSRGDWAACLRLSGRMKLSSQVTSELASKSSLRRVANGTHNLLKRPDGGSQSGDRVAAGTHHLLGGEIQRRMVAEGKHHLLGGEIQRKSNAQRIQNGTHNFLGPYPEDKRIAQRKNQQRLVEAGTHHLLGGKIQSKSNKERLAQGTHTSQQMLTCHCGATVNKMAFGHYHGKKCKVVPLI
jgi:hypothetical protein